MTLMEFKSLGKTSWRKISVDACMGEGAKEVKHVQICVEKKASKSVETFHSHSEGKNREKALKSEKANDLITTKRLKKGMGAHRTGLAQPNLKRSKADLKRKKLLRITAGTAIQREH